MDHYIATSINEFSSAEKHRLISATIAAIHDINYNNNQPVALTFNADAELGDMATITKIGLVGQASELSSALASRLALLSSDTAMSFEQPQRFSGNEPSAYFRSKPELDPASYQGQVKKRAINMSKRLTRLGTPVTVAELHAKHMVNLFNLQKTTPHLRIKQLSRGSDRLFNLCIIKVTKIELSNSSRKADLYGLRQTVKLLA